MIAAASALVGLTLGCALALGISTALLRVLVRTAFTSRYNVTDAAKRSAGNAPGAGARLRASD